MKEFIIRGADALGKWMAQNAAEYTGDFVEGCLLDNFVLAVKRGFAAVYEYPVSAWSSVYRVVWEAGAAQNLFREWYAFEAEAEAEAIEEENRYKMLYGRN